MRISNPTQLAVVYRFCLISALVVPGTVAFAGIGQPSLSARATEVRANVETVSAGNWILTYLGTSTTRVCHCWQNTFPQMPLLLPTRRRWQLLT